MPGSSAWDLRQEPALRRRVGGSCVSINCSRSELEPVDDDLRGVLAQRGFPLEQPQVHSHVLAARWRDSLSKELLRDDRIGRGRVWRKSSQALKENTASLPFEAVRRLRQAGRLDEDHLLAG